jgi:glycosyltransferase involved in cell wall biosynthesis
MRILYFSRDYTTHDHRFMTAIARTHDVWYLRLEDDGNPYEQRPLPDGVHPVDWPGGSSPAPEPADWLRLMPAFERALSGVNPDLVHAGPVQSCAFMAAVTGFHPLLSMSWGSDILVHADRDDLWRWLTGYTLRRSDALLCDNPAVRQRVHELAPFDPARIVEFPWGIDLDAFSPTGPESPLRSKLGWEDAVVALATRSWEEIYGIDTLLDAFASAHAANPDLRLLLMGEGSLAPLVRARIAGNGLGDVIHTPGVLPETAMPGIYRMSDIYVSCARSDGTSISLLQAMACGLPVVVSDVPGNRAWVEPEVNGWLARPDDAAGFAAALREAAALPPDARARLAARNRAVAETRADWRANVGQLMRMYAKLAPSHVSQGESR